MLFPQCEATVWGWEDPKETEVITDEQNPHKRGPQPPQGWESSVGAVCPLPRLRTARLLLNAQAKSISPQKAPFGYQVDWISGWKQGGWWRLLCHPGERTHPQTDQLTVLGPRKQMAWAREPTLFPSNSGEVLRETLPAQGAHLGTERLTRKELERHLGLPQPSVMLSYPRPQQTS